MIWLSPIVLIYVVWMIHWSRVWKKIPVTQGSTNNTIQVTIVTAMRNEKGNIGQLVQALDQQDLSKSYWKFILIDDHSMDSSLQEAEEALSRSDISYKVLRLPENLTGKKAAIQFGISHVESPWIITTDADCTMGESWLSTMVGAMAPDVHMISGPVTFTSGNTFASRFVMLDMISMIGIGAVHLYTGTPLLNNAANMGFRKDSFIEANPYATNKHASGDDIFLMKKIHRIHPGSLRFVKSPEAIVSSDPPANFQEFVHQRIRWSSKTASTTGSLKEFMEVAILYLTNVIVLVVPLVGIISANFILAITGTILLFLKIIADIVFFRSLLPFFGHTNSLRHAFISEVLHIPYVVLFGIAGIRGTYRWKSRKLQ